jgi:DNA-binding XRE family transcriptional regulator
VNLSLKTKILASGKPQLWLAREVKISEAQLSKIVGGWVEPRMELKKKIAKVLGCGVADIFATQRQKVIDGIEAAHEYL